MRISYFREFIVLARHLNFSVAASHLHMTQPGLSRHISRLEKEVGIRLFTRDTHRVQLTEKGEQFLRGIQKIIDDFDFLCETVEKKGQEKITIGVPYYGIKKYVSDIISPFESANPNVNIHYLPSYPDAIITGLLAKQVDVAVLPRVDFLHSEKLVFHDAFRESFVLLMNRNHPLAARSCLRCVDVQHEDFISLQGIWGDALLEEWQKLCRRHGLPAPKKKLETETIEEAALRVKLDSGVMLLPEHLKEANISGNIKCVDLLIEDFYLTISLVHHAENQNPAVEKFIRFYLKQSRRNSSPPEKL